MDYLERVPDKDSSVDELRAYYVSQYEKKHGEAIRFFSTLRQDLALHLEMMAAAYIKATDIPVEDCELVVQMLPDKVVYRFQRKNEDPVLINCPKCGNKGLMSAYLPMCTNCANKERGVSV